MLRKLHHPPVAVEGLFLVILLLLGAPFLGCVPPRCQVESARLPKNAEFLKMDGYTHVLLVPDNSSRDQLVALLEALSCQGPAVSELGISKSRYSSLLVRVFKRSDKEFASRPYLRSLLGRDREYFQRVVAVYELQIEGAEFGVLGSPALGGEVVFKRGPLVDELLETLKVKDWRPRGLAR